MNPRSASLLVLLAAFALSASSAQASPSTARKLLLIHELRHLPPGASFSRISALAVALVRLDPLRAVKYFKLGVRQLPASLITIAETNKLGAYVLVTAKRAGISANAISRIASKIYEEDTGPPPSPTPIEPP